MLRSNLDRDATELNCIIVITYRVPQAEKRQRREVRGVRVKCLHAKNAGCRLQAPTAGFS